MNWDVVTLQDCADMHSMKGYTAILNDGQILGFIHDTSAADDQEQRSKGRIKSYTAIIRAQERGTR